MCFSDGALQKTKKIGNNDFAFQKKALYLFIKDTFQFGHLFEK